MAAIFSITVANPKLNVGTGQKGTTSFNVTNATERAQRGYVKARPLDDMPEAWLTLGAGADFDLAPKTTTEVSVKVTVPADGKPGSYRFRLDAISATDPADDYTEGPVVSVSVQTVAPPRPSPMPWWIFALAALVLVCGGAGIWYGLRPVQIAVPGGLVGQPYASAAQVLTKANLSVERTDVVDNSVPDGQVTAQNPPPDTQLHKNDPVNLTVAKNVAQPGEFPNPMVQGTPLDLCFEWATACGPPAADAFCKQHGFVEAEDVRLAAHSPPTRVIGPSGRICNEPGCTRITWVKCTGVKLNFHALSIMRRLSVLEQSNASALLNR